MYHPFFFFFFKCCNPNPRPNLNGGSKPEPGLLRPFSFILSKTFYLCHFILEFSITWKYFIYNRHKAFLNIEEMVAIFTFTFTFIQTYLH